MICADCIFFVEDKLISIHKYTLLFKINIYLMLYLTLKNEKKENNHKVTTMPNLIDNPLISVQFIVYD